MQVCPDLGHVVRLGGLLPEAEIVGADDVWISGCACDSRQVREGELFAALVGSRRDGHDFIAEAVARGCAAVLSRAAACPSCRALVRGADVRGSHARLCQALAGNPSRQLKLIGVTGTNGKTTTSCLIAGVLTAAGHRVGVLGTLGYLDGRIVEDADAHHSAARPAGVAAGADGPQRVQPRRDGSFEPRARSIAGGGRELRRRLRDERHPGPSRLSRDPARLPSGEGQDFPASRRRKVSRSSTPTIRRSASLLRRTRPPGVDRWHPGMRPKSPPCRSNNIEANRRFC